MYIMHADKMFLKRSTEKAKDVADLRDEVLGLSRSAAEALCVVVYN